MAKVIITLLESEAKQMLLTLSELNSSLIKGNKDLSTLNRFRTAPKLSEKILKQLGWEITEVNNRRTIKNKEEMAKISKKKAESTKAVEKVVEEAKVETPIVEEPKNKEYVPTPMDLDSVEVPEELMALTEQLAENIHNVWAKSRMEQGWTYGETRNDELKQHPDLVPFSELADEEKQYDIDTSLSTIRAILKAGYKIVKADE